TFCAILMLYASLPSLRIPIQEGILEPLSTSPKLAIIFLDACIALSPAQESALLTAILDALSFVRVPLLAPILITKVYESLDISPRYRSYRRVQILVH